MKQLFFTSAIVILLLATGCTKKAKQTTINGQVRTYGTEDPIKHTPVKVQIVERIPGGLGSGPGFEQLEETWTDQNGYFSLSHGLYEGNDYFIAVAQETVKEKQGYIPPSNQERERHRITQVGGTYTKNYYLSAYGWVRFHFIDINNNDRFSYSVGGGGYEEFFNPDNEIIRIWDYGGNIEHSIALGKTKNGVDSVWREYIFVPAFDTTDYEIKY